MKEKITYKEIRVSEGKGYLRIFGSISSLLEIMRERRENRKQLMIYQNNKKKWGK